MRVGVGVDAHALVEGVPLVLGGVEVESTRGLAGHSDGDVIAHALIDALLGAAGMGDIGSLFPSGSDEWEGASSLDLLSRAPTGRCERPAGSSRTRTACSSARSRGSRLSAERCRRDWRRRSASRPAS